MSKSRAKKVNIVDVAKEAGVSIKTVSRVLNKEKYVSDAMTEKVQAAVSKLRYSPSLQARGLAGRRSHMVGLFVDDIAGDYIARTLSGMLRACAEQGSHLVLELLPQRGTEHTDERVRDLMSRVRFDGVILTPPTCDDALVLEDLREFGVPVERIGGSGPAEHMGLSMVDDFSAARDITNHLISKGHRAIGFVKGDPEHECSQAREDGFVHAMQAAGLPVHRDWFFPGEFSYASGLAAGEQIVQLGELPTAFFVSSDIMAAAIAEVLSRAGLRVPQDVSLAGFDDDAVCTIMNPKLTTIRQPVAEMAYAATRRVIEARRKDEPLDGAPTIFGYELIERDSVAAR